MSETSIRVSLELRLDGGSLRGAVEHDGRCRPFLGWLGLLAAIDALLDDDAPGPATGSGAHGTPTGRAAPSAGR